MKNTLNRSYTLLCTLSLLLVVLTLSGCATPKPDAEAKTLLETLEFENGERGCVDLRGEVDLNPLPLFKTRATLILKKDTGEGAPEC